MCGIVGYIGHRNAYDIVIKGLKLLEYRGYDSAGITLLDNKTYLYKKKGKVSDLEESIKDLPKGGTLGMGHTRWATHGEPNDTNAHPHQSQNGKFIVVHNGIIENYADLKKTLLEKGYSFKSETDTEVFANLLEYFYLQGNMSAEETVRMALSRVVGAYGLVILCTDEQDKIITARKGSPLVIGIGQGEYFVASDATPIVEYTKSVIYLNDDDVAVISRDGLQLKTIKSSQSIQPHIQEVDLNIGELDKGGYDHFMLKEIHEQPRSIADTFRGRILPDCSDISLGGLHEVWPKINNARRIIIVACGTSWHAGLVGEYLFEEYARIPVEVEYGSEFRYRNPIIYPDDVVIAISQSGETADTLAAIRIAKAQGALVLGICNVVGSSIPRETHAGVYTHAGPEIGVASTKAFTAQVTILTMMALKLASNRGTISQDKYRMAIKELTIIPEKIERALSSNEYIQYVSEKLKDSTNSIYLGRGYLYPVALEGALKLKEISYIHAEGYPAAEMKHGPIALIDEQMPVVVVATKDSSYEKIVSNIQEVKARKGIIIAIVTEGDTIIKNMAQYVIEVPETAEFLSPILSVIPLQLLSYYIAVMRGSNVDQPRNLAKSVTVE